MLTIMLALASLCPGQTTEERDGKLSGLSSQTAETASEASINGYRDERLDIPLSRTAPEPIVRERTILSSAFAGCDLEEYHKALLSLPSLSELEESDLELNAMGVQNGNRKARFQWRAAVNQSLLFLGLQHSIRFAQAKTTGELKGPFFRDYFRSIKALKGWGDGDEFVTNYLGHPAMGAVSGYIQIQNDPAGKRQQIGRSKPYWKSRMKAFAWATAYSIQFEIGPISEAAIGNVGRKPGTAGYVDHVITPTLGLASIVLEDMADSYLIRRIERHTANGHFIRLARVLLNPTRSVANLLRFKLPWHRDRL